MKLEKLSVERLWSLDYDDYHYHYSQLENPNLYPDPHQSREEICSLCIGRFAFSLLIAFLYNVAFDSDHGDDHPCNL